VQARAAAEYLGATYTDSTALVLGLRAVLDEPGPMQYLLLDNLSLQY
jgi:hypothetical protein